MEKIDSEKSIYQSLREQIKQSQEPKIINGKEAPVTQKLFYFDSKAQAEKFEIKPENLSPIDR